MITDYLENNQFFLLTTKKKYKLKHYNGCFNPITNFQNKIHKQSYNNSLIVVIIVEKQISH